MVRDEEITRLIRYAQGLNTSVKIKKIKENGNAAAEWTTDGSLITVYAEPDTSKIQIVLCLIHELGHHMVHIHDNDRKVDEKLEEAVDEDIKKSHRRRVYNWELKGAEWWEKIYRETDCKFNINKLFLEKEFDLWQYEVYYETGEFPSVKEKKKKARELKIKYE